jgi:CBS domain containing-hemolysin-like protein
LVPEAVTTAISSVVGPFIVTYFHVAYGGLVPACSDEPESDDRVEFDGYALTVTGVDDTRIATLTMAPLDELSTE